MKILIFVVSILLHFVASSHLECIFKTSNYLGDVYTCQFKYNLNISSPDNAYILSSSGTHLEQKCYDDVLAINSENKDIQYFPKGLEFIFKNLKAIDLQNNGLKELYQSDLTSFRSLVYLDLGKNDIEVLEDGVFDNNPHLEVISFYGNKIYHIDLQVFDSLSKLYHLVLDNNRCINKSARRDRSGVEQIVQDTKIMCQNSEFLKGGLLTLRRFLNHDESSNVKAQLKNIEINLLNRISELKQVIGELKGSQCNSNNLE
ncbi:leucine-rich repeat-containing protein 70-like [Chironomus tepperi]|uniref:leucine-rich repeat-containing protein 70-like n=1 Tax=Chironomus tepperi TaxID=113505 RepID=UPI00391F93B0